MVTTDGYNLERSQLGRILRKQREAMKISQQEMARRLGVCRQTIQKLESKDADEKIQPILEAYGISIRANIFTTPKLYTVRHEPIKRSDFEAWARMEKLIKRAMHDTWLMGGKD